jgi:hypothetical protein
MRTPSRGRQQFRQRLRERRLFRARADQREVAHQLLRRLGQGNQVAPLLLRQGLEHQFHFFGQMPRHGPVEGGWGQRLGLDETHAHSDTIRLLAGLVGVGERQHAVVHRQRLREGLRIVRSFLGRAEAVFGHAEELRLRRLLVAHEVHQLADR